MTPFNTPLIPPQLIRIINYKSIGIPPVPFSPGADAVQSLYKYTIYCKSQPVDITGYIC